MSDFTWIKGIILGLVQGATEFFPVSSSAHLVIAENYLGIKDSAKNLAAFDVALHFGTLVAAILFFRKDIECLIGVWLPKWRAKLAQQENPETLINTTNAKKLGAFLIMGILPVGLIAAKFGQFFTDLFSDTIVVAVLLIITGFVLSTTRKIHSDSIGADKMNFKHALLIGVAQIFAVLPGISRSGMTMSTALFLRLKPELAFRFSFLMMIILVSGAVVLDIPQLLYLPPSALVSAALGCIVAGGVGFFCIPVMLKIICDKKIYIFSYYCWAVGILVLLKELIF